MGENKLTIDDFLGEEIKFIDVKRDKYFPGTAQEKSMIDEILVHFADKSIVIVPVAETDEIKVTFSKRKNTNEGIDTLEQNILSKYIGKTFNQVWNCVNSNGYFDLYILGFSYLDPSVLVLCEGSTLRILELKR